MKSPYDFVFDYLSTICTLQYYTVIISVLLSEKNMAFISNLIFPPDFSFLPHLYFSSASEAC